MVKLSGGVERIDFTMSEALIVIDTDSGDEADGMPAIFPTALQ